MKNWRPIRLHVARGDVDAVVETAVLPPRHEVVALR